MKTTGLQGGRRRRPARAAAIAGALWATLLIGCTTTAVPQPADSAMADDLAEMQIRIRLLQTELALLRSSLNESSEERARSSDRESALRDSLSALEARIAALPEQLSGMCPEPPVAATVNAQCEPGPDAQRVVVSGDKLVLGVVERVWIDPPGTFLEAKIDAGSETSTLNAAEVVEFERDGSRWVRFDLALGEDTATVERPLKRFVRLPGASNGSARRPAVDLRVQIGDVREQVEVILSDRGTDQALVLGRNFLTDVALVDVARQHVQPAFQAP